MLFAAALVFTGCSNGSDSGGGTPPTPPPKHAVTFSVDGTHGTLTAKVGGAEISSGDKVEQGKTIVFTATPDSGFHVKGWTLDGNAVNGTNSSYSFPVTKAAEVKVSFESNSTPLPQYAVNFSVDGANGTLKAKADGVPETETSPINVEKGKTVTFTAFPAAGYEVKEWQIFGTGMVFEAGTGTAGNNTAKVNLKGNLTVKVSFKVQTLTPKHLVTMSAGTNGGITAEPALPADGMVNENTIITFTAKPNEGYTVDAWTITGGQLLAGGQAGSSTAMVKITEPVTVAVSFKLKPPTTYTVSFGVAGTNGSISAKYKAGGAAFTSGTAVAENTVLVFTASPATGYKVEKWTENGTTIEGNITNTYEHTVTKAADIRVSFVSSITIPDNFTLSNGAEYKVVDKEQKHVIMTKRGNGSVGSVYTVAVTVEYSGITYTLTGFSKQCISDFGYLTSLTAFALSGESAFLSVDDGVLFDKAKTKLIRYPNGKAGTSYTVPASVTVLGDSSFEGNDTLTAIMLPTTGLTTIEDGALYCCYELKTVNIPSTLTSIGSAFLGYSKVEDVKIPEGVTELDNLFLNNCEELKTLELPSTFTEHLRGDFCKNCTALQSVTCMATTPPALGAGPFSGVTLSGVTLKVPSASVSAYEGAAVWKDFKKPFLTLP
ncbi:InlB B-repeat-containing protein [Treponema sp. SP13]|uniref:InlB B-repeat-containing protein n=1 Tax=Treponema sp. SP13 TaxID=2789742 RepID=UPI003D8C1208